MCLVQRQKINKLTTTLYVTLMLFQPAWMLPQVLSAQSWGGHAAIHHTPRGLVPRAENSLSPPPQSLTAVCSSFLLMLEGLRFFFFVPQCSLLKDYFNICFIILSYELIFTYENPPQPGLGICLPTMFPSCFSLAPWRD